MMASPDITVTTPRLILRRARMSDLENLHRVFTQALAMRYWSVPEHDHIDQTKAFLEGMIRSENADDFVIEHQGRVVGKAGEWNLPEIGYILHPDLWGQGLGYEAVSAVIAHLFATHPVTELTAEVDPRNLASRSLLAKLGFHETGRAERTLKWREEWCDSIYLSLPRPLA
ncbi:MAG: GNAT family N-acetyltransferase [Rhodobacteraceae bacterium]|nr:GNAT family N-acetyltransferase [Paracoccaceae bacterium]MCF8520735.1 GNAT family N-acetyltransferase [Paracoccaceae bacterium]